MLRTALIAAALSVATALPANEPPKTPTAPPTAQLRAATPTTPPAIFAGGQWRPLGGLKPEAKEEKQNARSLKHPTLEPETRVPATKHTLNPPRVAPTLDQNGYSCCASAAPVQCQFSAAGVNAPDQLQLSVCDLYYRVNGGSDQGNTLYAAQQALSSAGVCSTTTATLWGVLDPQHKPGWQQDRKTHSPGKITYCETLEELNNELDKQHPAIFGCDVNESFAPNEAGIIGPRKPTRGDGHCLFTDAYSKVGTETYYHIQNSWGTQWGINGRAQLDSSWLNLNDYGAYSFSPPQSPPTCTGPSCPCNQPKPRWMIPYRWYELHAD